MVNNEDAYRAWIAAYNGRVQVSILQFLCERLLHVMSTA